MDVIRLKRRGGLTDKSKRDLDSQQIAALDSLLDLATPSSQSAQEFGGNRKRSTMPNDTSKHPPPAAIYTAPSVHVHAIE
eukprot:679437-Alexandrium_andersonii.AAC.1